MSTKTPRPGESSVLGESWVVAPPNPSNGSPATPTKTPTTSSRASNQSDRERKANNGSDSMSTSASSMSGPELIMPSIYEAPISEASWVAPALRSKTQQANASLKRRHASTRDGAHSKQNQSGPAAIKGKPAEARPAQQQARGRTILPTSKALTQFLRPMLNLLLLAAIAHLLVLPELVQQYQTLCSIDTLSTLYPASCIPPFPQPHHRHNSNGHPQSSRYETVTSAQTHLESLLNNALQQMHPLSNSLKHSESHLRDAHTALKQAYPSPKHELDLEFDGCWAATRAATTKFDSLRADMRSAVDNLVVTAGSSGVSSSSRQSSVAQDARLSTQMLRREQYIEQLTARMQSKADSLASDLALLDDHLDSIAGIIEREGKHTSVFSSGSNSESSSSSSDLDHNNNNNNNNGDVNDNDNTDKQSPESKPKTKTLWSLLDSYLPTKLSPNHHSPDAPDSPTPNNDDNNNKNININTSLTKLFEHAAAQHRPVTEAVQTLSYRLQTLQNRRGM